MPRVFLLGITAALLVGAASRAADGVVVDREKRTVTIDAKIAPRKINDERYKEIYPIEVIACWPFPKGEKAHETVVTIDVKPSEVHKALEALGLKPGKPVVGESKQPPQGPEINVYIDVPGSDGRAKRVPIDRALLDPKNNKPLPKSVRWRFTGSVMVRPDPDKPDTLYGADQSGTLIAIFPVTDKTVCQTNLLFKDEKYLKLETNKNLLPPEGTPVKLVLEVPGK
jgi:hypothetical protein